MKSISIAGAVLAVLSLTGCFPSLHPIYTTDTTTYDKALVGKWSGKWGGNNKTDAVWEFKAQGGQYKVTYTDSDGTAHLTAVLAKIGDDRYIDLFPEEPEFDNTSQLYAWHLLPVHTFLKVEQIEPNLKMAWLNPKGFENTLKADPEALKTDKIHDRLVITASTEELQEFLKKNAKNKELFEEYSDLKRAEE